jgi:molybdenum-dependent DNA-binding transcriptional regulator ModE
VRVSEDEAKVNALTGPVSRIRRATSKTMNVVSATGGRAAGTLSLNERGKLLLNEFLQEAEESERTELCNND